MASIRFILFACRTQCAECRYSCWSSFMFGWLRFLAVFNGGWIKVPLDVGSARVTLIYYMISGSHMLRGRILYLFSVCVLLCIAKTTRYHDHFCCNFVRPSDNLERHASPRTLAFVGCHGEICQNGWKTELTLNWGCSCIIWGFRYPKIWLLSYYSFAPNFTFSFFFLREQTSWTPSQLL